MTPNGVGFSSGFSSLCQWYMQVIKGWYTALPGEMQQVMKELAGKPYTIDRSALPKDSRAPSEAQAMARQTRAASHQHKRHIRRPAYRSAFLGQNLRAGAHAWQCVGQLHCGTRACIV